MVATMTSISMALLGATLSDPLGPSVLLAAVNWVSGTMFGAVATVLATIGVAVVGMRMLTGRLEWRRGVTVVIGCFILLGAPRIASGLRGTADDAGFGSPPLTPVVAPLSVAPMSRTVPDSGYDPYAGASVPAGEALN